AMTLAHRVAVMNKGVVQQIAPPREIYDDPTNLFVAGFIGSPPMNTLSGALYSGSFVVPQGKIAVGAVAERNGVMLGFRSEDAEIVAPAAGDLAATVFACELTGNETIVTCQVGSAQVVVQMGKEFDIAVDAAVGIRIDAAKVCLFDANSGDRLRVAGPRSVS